MRTHFDEEFRLLTPSEFSLWRNLTGADNIWRQFDQVVCPVDAIKPVEKRRGWSKEKLEAYNQERLGDLIDAGWDLIICDEAHRLGGSTEQVARYRLGKSLAEAAPYLLLLGDGARQRLLAGDVLSHLHRSHGDHRVPMIRRGCEHGLDVLLFVEHLAEIHPGPGASGKIPGRFTEGFGPYLLI